MSGGLPPAGGVKLVLTRHIRAEPAKVYAACSQTEMLRSWFGPHDFEVCEVEADVRVGGRFAFRMQQKGGGTYGAEGVYREVVPGERLVLTWKWNEAPEGEELDGVESRVTIDIRRDGDGTMLTLTHEGLADQASADSHREGWSGALDKLVAYVGAADGSRRR